MDAVQITQKTIDCVAQSLALEASEISTKSQLINDLNADSIDFLDITFELEDEFGVMLQKEDLHLLNRLNIEKESAVNDKYVTQEVKRSLRRYLPEIPIEQDITLAQVASFISVETLVIIIQEKLAEA